MATYLQLLEYIEGLDEALLKVVEEFVLRALRDGKTKSWFNDRATPVDNMATASRIKFPGNFSFTCNDGQWRTFMTGLTEKVAFGGGFNNELFRAMITCIPISMSQAAPNVTGQIIHCLQNLAATTFAGAEANWVRLPNPRPLHVVIQPMPMPFAVMVPVPVAVPEFEQRAWNEYLQQQAGYAQAQAEYAQAQPELQPWDYARAVQEHQKALAEEDA
jgi:hypothetical protein